MYFANPWGLLGLLALPAILGIHLYHRRFPPLPIAGLHLWSPDVRKDSPGRTREKLPWTRSLFLELLAALLMALLVADPRSDAANTRPHVVIVLDDSASMGAVSPADGLSSRDRAVEWIRAQEDRWGRAAVLSILASGQRPTLIAGPRADWEETGRAMDRWQPRGTWHDFASAWDLGAQLANNEAEFVFLTDAVPAEQTLLPERMDVVAVGQKLDNVGITAARWVFDAEQGTGLLFARIANFGERSAEVKLQGVASSGTLIQETHPLDAGAEKSFEWIIPGGVGELTFSARVANDPLEIDNAVTLIEPQVRLVTVAVTLPSAHPAFESVRRILGVLPHVQLGDPGTADLVIAPAADTPLPQRGLWWLGMGPLAVDDAARGSSRTLVGPYLLEKQHPLLTGVVLGGVVWGGVQPNPENCIPLISSGSSILMGQRTGSAANAFVLNIDLTGSNLTESPDWPILWTNLIENCRVNLPGFRRWNFQRDESITLTLDDERLESEDPLELIFASERKPLIRTATVEIPARDQTGVYEVLDGTTRLGRFAVNFLDRKESRLLDLNSGTRPARQQERAIGIHWDNPFSWLLVLGTLAVLSAIYADWILLRRRS